jgi:uncharacterized protein (TIGR02266 family)
MAEEKKRLTSYSLIEEDIPSDAPAHAAGERLGVPEFRERRTAPRSHLEADVTITSEGQEFQGMTHDISRTGVFVSSYRVLRVGAQVQLKLVLPNGTVIAKGVIARVRRSSDGITGGMGIVFGRLDALDRSLIEAYCAEEPVRRTSDVRISRPRPR